MRGFWDTARELSWQARYTRTPDGRWTRRQWLVAWDSVAHPQRNETMQAAEELWDRHGPDEVWATPDYPDYDRLHEHDDVPFGSQDPSQHPEGCDLGMIDDFGQCPHLRPVPEDLRFEPEDATPRVIANGYRLVHDSTDPRSMIEEAMAWEHDSHPGGEVQMTPEQEAACDRASELSEEIRDNHRQGHPASSKMEGRRYAELGRDFLTEIRQADRPEFQAELEAGA